MDATQTDRRATLAREIDRLREAEEDTLDHRERLHLAAERTLKERELVGLPTPEPAVARAPLPVNGTRPPSNAGGNDADEVKNELRSGPLVIADSEEPKPKPPEGPLADGSKDHGMRDDTASTPPRMSGLAVIPTYDRLPRDIANDAEQALLRANDPTWAYVHGEQLMKLRLLNGGGARIEPITFDMLSRRLHEICDFRGGKGVARTAPQAVVKYLLNADAYPGFPVLAGVVTTPVLRADGTVLSKFGYDPKSGLFLATASDLNVPRIPDAPTRDDVFRARDFLFDFIADFPFVGSADKANLLAAWMTPVIRPAFTGSTPLFMFDKPESGTGATLLAMIVKGTADGNVALNGMPTRDEELEKRITSWLQDGAGVIVWDNVDHLLSAGVLSRLLTSVEWEGRILGLSKIVRFPNNTLWIVTGNNVPLGGDLPRRVVLVRLDAEMPRPMERKGFKHVLPRAVLEQRGAVIAAILTMARGWFVAGCPSGPRVRADNFAPWARICGGILAHAGVEGFLGNLHLVLANAEDERAECSAFMEALYDKFQSAPFLAADVAELIAGYSDLPAIAPPDVRKAMKGDGLAQALGHFFLRQRDKVFDASGGRRLQLRRSDDHSHKKVATWCIQVLP